MAISFDKTYDFFHGKEYLWTIQSMEIQRNRVLAELLAMSKTDNTAPNIQINEDGLYTCPQCSIDKDGNQICFDIILKFLNNKCILFNYDTPYIISKVDLELMDNSLVNVSIMKDNIAEYKLANGNISIFFNEDPNRKTGIELIGVLRSNSLSLDMFLNYYDYESKATKRINKYSNLIFNFKSYEEIELEAKSIVLKIEDFYGRWKDENSIFSISASTEPECSIQNASCFAIMDSGTNYFGKASIVNKCLFIQFEVSNKDNSFLNINQVLNLQILSYSRNSFCYKEIDKETKYYAKRVSRT